MKISTTQYANALHELTKNKSEDQTVILIEKFAKFLQKNGEMNRFKAITEKFSQIFNKENGIVELEVVSSKKLAVSTLDLIKTNIAKKYSAKEVIVHEKVDSKILGGIVIRVGNEQYDASIKSQLKELQKELSS